MSKIVDAHTGIYKLQKDSLFSEKEYLNNQEVNKNFMDVVAKRKELYADRISLWKVWIWRLQRCGIGFG